LQGESKAFGEGLLAYYSQQYEKALEKAREALEKEPWIYEALKLQGDVYYAYGFAKQKRGQYEEARADYRRAAELYHDGAEQARSDSSIHSAEADMWVQVMDVDKTEGLSPKEAFERALAACDRAILSNPENDSAVRKKVWAYIRWAEYQSTHGEDPRNAAQQAIDAAQLAVRLNPGNAFPYDQMGMAYLLIARAENDHGQDTSESEKHAAESFQKSVEVNPNFAWAWNDFGVLHSAKAEWLSQRGAEYRDELAASISKLQRAIEADPEYHIAYSNLVDVYKLLARYEMDHGRSPDAWIEKAIETSNLSLQVNPNFYETYRNMASIYSLQAQYESILGRSPETQLAEALERLDKAMKANPNDADTHRELAQVYCLRARHLLEQHHDAPDEALSKGLLAIQKSNLISPNNPDGYLLQVQLLLLVARNEAQHGKSPLSTLQQAQGAVARARELNSKIPAVYLNLGEIARATVEWKIEHQKPADEDIADGQAAIDQALNLSPALTPALAVRGTLYLLMARMAHGSAPRKQAAELAVRTFQQALSKDPLLDREFGALLGEATQLSR
jgi:serine/threonine-protein kinase